MSHPANDKIIDDMIDKGGSMTHTKGKWEIIQKGTDKMAMPAIIQGKYLVITVDCGENFGDPLPDARLIASAPLLLDACREILSCFPRASNTPYSGWDLAQALDNLQQVIKQAEKG